MPQVDIKIRSTADTSGIERIQAGLTNLRNEVNRRFSIQNVGQSVLGGLGLGSGFAIAHQALQRWAAIIGEAQENARSLAEYIAQTRREANELSKLRLDLFLGRQTPEQQLATLTGELAKLDQKIEETQEKTAALNRDLALAGNAPRGTIAGSAFDPLQGRYGSFRSMKGVGDLIESQQREVEAMQQDLEKQRTALQKQIQGVQRAIANANERTTQTEQKQGADDIAQSVKNYLEKVLKPTLAAEHKLLETRQRSAAEKKKTAFSEEERRFAQQLADLEQERALIQNNALLTEQQKSEQLVPLLDRINRLIAERIQLLATEQKLSGDPAYRLQLQEQIDRLNRDRARNSGETTGLRTPETMMVRHGKSILDLGDPSKHYQSGADGAIGSLVEQGTQIGTFGDQVANAFTNAGQSIRSSLGSAFADAIIMGGNLVDRLRNFAGAVGTAFINAGAQMLADWIMKHTLMAAASAIFRTKEVAQTAITEGAKTTIVTTGEATRTGVVGAAAAANTGIITGAAGVQAGATGIAGVFRSIMELGPIAGPAVFAASVAGMIALVAGLVNGFEKGGFPSGRNSLIRVNENGQEAVLNAGAVARLGRAGVDALNNGEMWIPDPALSITRPAYQRTAGGAASGAAGGDDERGQVAFVDGRDRKALEDIERDPRFRTKIVKIVAGERRRLGIRI